MTAGETTTVVPAEPATALVQDVDSYRQRREGALRYVLDTLPAPYLDSLDVVANPVQRWALVNHLYRTAVSGIGPDRSTARLSELLSGWLEDGGPARMSPALLDPPVVVDAANAATIEVNADMPTRTISPQAIRDGASEEGRRATHDAVDLLHRYGFGPLIDRGLGVVVLLHRREVGEATSSWATTVLPATIYTDWYPDPSLLAKDLVHETTHTWLNDALDARAVQLPTDEIYWSPWKQRNRPAYGMVHSIAAFSQVVQFLAAAVQDQPNSVVATYGAARLRQEGGRLLEAHEAATAALDRLPDEEIRAWVADGYEAALERYRSRF